MGLGRGERARPRTPQSEVARVPAARCCGVSCLCIILTKCYEALKAKRCYRCTAPKTPARRAPPARPARARPPRPASRPASRPSALQPVHGVPGEHDGPTIRYSPETYSPETFQRDSPTTGSLCFEYTLERRAARVASGGWCTPVHAPALSSGLTQLARGLSA